MLRIAVIAFWAVVAACVVPGGAEAAPRDALKLSDEASYSAWAHPVTERVVRRAPTDTAAPLTRLRLFTEDGPREVSLVLASWRDPAGDGWFHIRVAGRPNGRTGWVRESALGTIHTLRTVLVVDRRRLKATLRRGGRKVWSSRIGVGRPSMPTPAGRFWIRERLRPRNPGGLYGPWAFGTSAYSTLSDWPGGGVVGIHGTNSPWLIPGRPSHGCVRVPNPAIRRLARILPIGTPVRVR